MIEQTEENTAILDATVHIAAEKDWTMNAQRAHVRIVRRAGGVTERKGNRVNWIERETFGAEYVDSTHLGRYCGLSAGTLEEIVKTCDAKGYETKNVLRLKEGAREVVRLWSVADYAIAA